jgi:hypothetical protein
VPLPTEDLDQLIVHDLDDLLARLDAVQHVGPQRALAHASHELLDNLEVDIRLEQRETNLAQGDVEVGLGDLGLASQTGSDRLETRGQGFEHQDE